MTVEIPAGLAGEVLRYLVLGLREHVSRGGSVTPGCQIFLHEMRGVADVGPVVRPDRHVSTTVEIESVTGVGIAEASARLGYSPRHVRRLAETGRIAARRTGGVWLVDPTTYRKDTAA